jgi:hypothetical protein
MLMSLAIAAVSATALAASLMSGKTIDFYRRRPGTIMVNYDAPLITDKRESPFQFMAANAVLGSVLAMSLGLAIAPTAMLQVFAIIRAGMDAIRGFSGSLG